MESCPSTPATRFTVSNTSLRRFPQSTNVLMALQGGHRGDLQRFVLASPLPAIVRREIQPDHPLHKLIFSSYNPEQLDDYMQALARSVSDGDSLLEKILDKR